MKMENSWCDNDLALEIGAVLKLLKFWQTGQDRTGQSSYENPKYLIMMNSIQEGKLYTITILSHKILEMNPSHVMVVVPLKENE